MLTSYLKERPKFIKRLEKQLKLTKMKNDVNGCSTTAKGSENYESFYSSVVKKQLVQYDFRSESGELFSCVAANLDLCRSKRDNWIALNLVAEYKANPNCRPALWISTVSNISETTKAAFLRILQK